LIGRGNNLKSIGTTTLPADLSTILQAFGTANTGTTNAQLAVSGLAPDYAGLMNAITSLRQTIYNYVDATITDFDTVVNQLPGCSTQDVLTVLALLYQDMLDNSQTVLRSTVTVGAVSADANNVGNGTILLDGYLDGYQAGVPGGFQTIRYAGVLSELCPPSTVHAWNCTGDSYGGGAQEGNEPFSWSDSLDYGPFPSFPEGAGSGPALDGNGQSTNIPGGNMESWSGGLPSGWGATLGAAQVSQDTVNFYRGSSSLAATAGGSTIALSVPIPAGTLNPRRRYMITARLLRTGAAAAGSLTLGFNGTPYAPRILETYSIPFSSISTSWMLVNFAVTMPAQIPSNFAFLLTFVGGIPPGCQINVDDVYAYPVTYFAGVNGTAVAGSTPFAVGDKFTATVTSVEGKFQSFFRQQYKAQLPSLPATFTSVYALSLPYTLFTSSTGGPSIPDSYAN
jgi:hypothetical protein